MGAALWFIIFTSAAATVAPEAHVKVSALASPAVETVYDEADVISGTWPSPIELSPFIGNGLVGWNGLAEELYVAGLYCGQPLLSHVTRCHVPAPPSLRTQFVGGSTSMSVALDVREAKLTETLALPTGTNATITRSWYAHRTRPNVLVSEIVLINPDPRPVSVAVVPNATAREPPHDIDFSSAAALPSDAGLIGSEGLVLQPEPGAPTTRVAMVWTNASATLWADAASTARLLLVCAIRTGDASAAVLDEAASDAREALAAGAAALAAEHLGAWSELWRGGVEVEGNTTLARQLNATLYALLSSTRPDARWPMGPGGLATDGYGGNAFWDNDVWTAPALLPMWPPLAEAALRYRYERRDAARRHAAAHAYQGMWFPWQTAGTGDAVDLAPFANQLEVHVGGGIALLAERLYDATRSAAALGLARDLAAAISDFYVSRATAAPDGSWSLRGVVPPDEFATGFPYAGVDDSAYTHAIARRTGDLAARTAGDPSLEASRWAPLANLTILLAEEGTGAEWHPEYRGFPRGNVYSLGKVKQADVTMLPYPLEVAMPATTQRNDLIKYEALYDAGGPAMTLSISVLGWLALGELPTAARRFEESKLHMHPPFHSWTESRDASQHPTLKDEGCCAGHH